MKAGAAAVTDIDGLTAGKQALRKQAFAARALAHEERNTRDPAANAALLAVLPGLAGDIAGKTVAIYQPMRTEISPLEAAGQMLARGARLCTPVIVANDSPLRFMAWTPDSTMTDGAFGARIPVSGDWLEPDIVIAPLVGWDRRGARLGYGGGFYDRTLERLRATKTTPAIGFAYAAQEPARAPQEPTDQPLDAIVTEQETLVINRRN